MPGNPWTEAEVAWMRVHADASYEEFTAAFGTDRSFHAWRHKRTHVLADIPHGLGWRTAPRTRTREMVDAVEERVIGHQTVTDPASDGEWEAYFASLVEADEQARALDTTQQHTTWYAPDDGLPVGVVFSGDWHVGARGVLYRQLDADLDTLRETPGLYGIHMGDAHEGVSIHSKASPALYAGLFNSGDEQERYVLMRMRRGGDRWLVWLEGNHDAWCYKHAGLSRISRLAEGMGIPHFSEGGGTVFAHVGAHRYALGVRHNHAGRALNSTNPQRRMFDEWPEWENLHVATIAHLHFNDIQIASRKGQRCVYVRSGTYKVHDAYAKAGGFTPEYGTPLVVLYPDREKVIGFRGDDIEDGLRFLAAERQRYATG